MAADNWPRSASFPVKRSLQTNSFQGPHSSLTAAPAMSVKPANSKEKRVPGRVHRFAFIFVNTMGHVILNSSRRLWWKKVSSPLCDNIWSDAEGCFVFSKYARYQKPFGYMYVQANRASRFYTKLNLLELETEFGLLNMQYTCISTGSYRWQKFLPGSMNITIPWLYVVHFFADLVNYGDFGCSFSERSLHVR